MALPPAALSAAISIYAAAKAYDSYVYYRDSLTEGADESFARASELWRLDQRIKERVPEGYEWLASIPEYEVCEDALLRSSVNSRSEAIRASRDVARQLGTRGQIGQRRRIAREVSLSLTRNTVASLDLARQTEEKIKQIWLDMKDQSVLDGLGVGNGYNGVIQASRNSAALFSELALDNAQAFNASVSAFGLSLSQGIKAFDGKESTPVKPVTEPIWNKPH